MKLKYLGERKAIELIADITKTDTSDDCAVIKFDKKFLLVTTDAVNEMTHIPRGATPYQIGWYAVAVNLSDIAAKGGIPIGIVVAISMHKNTDSKFLMQLTAGMNACAKKYNTKILGGDTKESDSLHLCGTAFGIVGRNEIMLRKGAIPKDIVCVTGTLGKASAGLYLNKPGNVLMVKPRIAEGQILARTHAVTSCMDISDGLASSLYQLSALNNVGFEIYHSKLPIYSATQDSTLKYLPKNYRLQSIAKAAEKQRDLLRDELVLYSGGDYELLLTVKKSKLGLAQKHMKKTNTKLTPIGKVTRSKEIFLIKKNKKIPLENRGYEHFKSFSPL